MTAQVTKPVETAEEPFPAVDISRLTEGLKSYVSREVVFDEPDMSYSRLADEERLSQVFLETIVELGAKYKADIQESDELKKMVDDKRVTRALTKLSLNAFAIIGRNLSDANHDDKEQISHLNNDKRRAKSGKKKLLEFFGIDQQIGVEGATTESNQPISERTARILNEVSSTPEEEKSKALADAYVTVYSPVQRLLEVLRSKEVDQKSQIEGRESKALRLNHIKNQALNSAVAYMHELASLFGKSQTPAELKLIAETFTQDIKQAKNKYAQQWDSKETGVLTGLLYGVTLEVVSLGALTEAASRYGWSGVRRATPEEDRHEGTDIYITTDDRDFRIDIKSKWSFQRQWGEDINIKGIKIKRWNKHHIIVVDAPTLGGVPSNRQLVTEFSGENHFAESISQAMRFITQQDEKEKLV